MEVERRINSRPAWPGGRPNEREGARPGEGQAVQQHDRERPKGASGFLVEIFARVVNEVNPSGKRSE